MILSRLELRDFRNYVREKVDFSPRVSIFFGANAQGKTNLVEAVYYMALGRSFRTRRDEEIIRYGEESFFLRGLFQDDDGELSVELGCGAKDFRGKINGSIVKRRMDLFGLVHVVLFSPDDLQLVKGGPQFRRDYLDLYLSQAYPRYRWTFYQYCRVLQQRNNLLKQVKEGKSAVDLLEPWDESMIRKGTDLIQLRLQAMKTLSPTAGRLHLEISGRKEELFLSYSGFGGRILHEEDQIEQLFRNSLAERKGEEIARGVSLVGPHRDDLLLLLDGEKDLRVYGSQGQQRTAALALKMSMVDLIGQVTGKFPILLLDDVLSEFDDTRKQSLLSMLSSSTQTIVTTADLSNSKLFGADADLYRVEDGHIVRC